MTEQTVCLRAKRATDRDLQRGRAPETFKIEVPAHLAQDFGLAPHTARVIRCDRPQQLVHQGR